MDNIKNSFFSFLNLKEIKQYEINENIEDRNHEYYITSIIKYFDNNGNKIYFNNKPNTEKCFGNYFRFYYVKELNDIVKKIVITITIKMITLIKKNKVKLEKKA
jgi:bifunctional N-acetylglucosamine-1-phosphate-uridyltransferase/glucosamine-1-phosphate-acetyltransferase GlmU-like protein